jgi:hypothetical protein
VRRFAIALVAATLAATAPQACSLNPQPLPPGEQPDAHGTTANPTPGSGADAGTAQNGSSSGGSSGSSSGSGGGFPDASVGADAATANEGGGLSGDDGSTDGETDAAVTGDGETGDAAADGADGGSEADAGDAASVDD